jgi:L-rhamnose mutarotase
MKGNMTPDYTPLTQRYCLTLDLQDDPQLIAEYKRHHENVWPEIVSTFNDAGIVSMEIYLYVNRLFMVMEVNERFSFEAKAKADRENPKVREWETLMWKFQKPLQGSKPGEKWMLMEQIFKVRV